MNLFNEVIEAIVKDWIPFDNGSSDRIALRHTIHKHLDPVRTIDVVLPVKVIEDVVFPSHPHLLGKGLGFDLQIAADFINQNAIGRNPGARPEG